tara:strand:+ start:2838 stop:4682 length:1845 start_codon:yes stop_codon:yes gene_type:complete
MKKLFSLFLVTLFSVSLSHAQKSGYWQQEVDYTMEIDVDAPKHQFTGKQKLIYTNNSPDVLDRVYYHLYFNAFQPGSMMDVRSRTIADPDSRVRDRIYYLPEDEIGYHHILSLKQDGKDVEYEVDETILVVELNTPIAPGATTTFDMDFESQVPRQVRRSGWANAMGVEFSMSQWYPKLSEYDERGWHPNPYIGREFHGVFGDFDVKITIDKNYVLGGTGIIQNPNEVGYGYQDEGKKVTYKTDKITWHFKAENVIDFFWGADPDYVHKTAQVPGGAKIHVLYQSKIDETASDSLNEVYKKRWEALPEQIVKAMEYGNKHFGVYPYPQFSAIQGGDGAMEYPMGTFLRGASTGSMIHELYHSWFQNVLATNESLYEWMDEGFTSFATSETRAYLNNVEGNPHTGSYRGYFGIVRSGIEEPMTTHADHYHTNAAYGRAAYSKGSVFLYQLSYIIGDEAFRKGMLTYHDTWKLKHPTDLDFIRVMEKESGMILDWYYEYFVQTTKTIDYAISSITGNEASTKVDLKRVGLMPMPLDLVVEYTDGTTELFYIPLRIMRGEKPAENDIKRTILEDWPWVNPSYSFEIPTSKKNIKGIMIDPTSRMADINIANNSVAVE